ncbi:MAG: hypothetical protein ACJ76J_06745 [Thermoanaerobaculia bacterium]
MIRCQFTEPSTLEWKAWRKEARLERKALLQGGSPYVIKDDLYKRRRDELFDLYYRKCAYCEGKFRLGELGDVEHFRPKGGVRDADNNIVYVAVAGKQEKHPGYYWLAYEPSNLFPSCSLCNRLALGGGKGERFPVADARATRPGQEKKEKPLLLHPLEDDPTEHLVFDPATGLLGHKTARGEACIKIFGLNTREDLVDERRNVYLDLMSRIDSLTSKFRIGGPDFQANLARVASYRSGQAAYCLAGRKALDDSREPLKNLFDALLPLV